MPKVQEYYVPSVRKRESCAHSRRSDGDVYTIPGMHLWASGYNCRNAFKRSERAEAEKLLIPTRSSKQNKTMTKRNKKSDREKLKDIRKRSEISEENTGCLVYPHEEVWLQSIGSSRSIYRAVAMLSGIKILPGEIAFPACGTERCCADGHIKVMSRKDEAAFQADKINNPPTRIMKFASGKMPATSVFTWMP